MAFFSKRELSLIERFESALKDKHLAREKLTDRLRAAETALGEKRAAATRLAMAGAADAQLDWAEADMRTAEDRTKTLHTALAQLDEQIATTERELADAKTQRDRDIVADELREDGYGNRASCSKLRCSCGRTGRDYHKRRGVNSGND